MEQQTLHRLNTLSDELQNLCKPLNTARYTAPLNRDAEQQRLFAAYPAGYSYNPEFSYHTPPNDWDRSVRQFLLELKPDENVWEHLIYQDVVVMLEQMQAVKTRDPALTTASTLKVYGELSDELVHAAYNALNEVQTETEPRNISGNEMAAKMSEALSQIGLLDWCVIVDSTMNARMSVRSVDKQIKVNSKHFFTVGELKRLLVHEIGTHVFRAVNGSLQPLRLLQVGLYNYMLTEEGLANYHEACYGVQTYRDRQRYALRVIAAYKSLKESFYEVFCELVQYTTPEEAFDIVTRAKRGFTDTSVPGCHVKDKVYFEGFRKVSAHLHQYPDDYVLLMCGKISLDMLPLLRELQDLGYLDSPKYLPGKLI